MPLIDSCVVEAARQRGLLQPVVSATGRIYLSRVIDQAIELIAFA